MKSIFAFFLFLLSSSIYPFENKLNEKSMIISIGSTNQAKVQAVKEVIRDYPLLFNAEIITASVPSEIADQPLSLAETIQGAKNRAKNAFAAASKKCTYGIGIESGLCETSGAQTNFMHASICAIYDGKTYYLGLSSGFEVPPIILKLVLDKKMTLSQACNETKVCANPNIGSDEGFIGILTKGRVTRKDEAKQCLKMALIQIENHSLYSRSSD